MAGTTMAMDAYDTDTEEWFTERVTIVPISRPDLIESYIEKGWYIVAPRAERACGNTVPEEHILGEFPMDCHRCHVHENY